MIAIAGISSNINVKGTKSTITTPQWRCVNTLAYR